MLTRTYLEKMTHALAEARTAFIYPSEVPENLRWMCIVDLAVLNDCLNSGMNLYGEALTREDINWLVNISGTRQQIFYISGATEFDQFVEEIIAISESEATISSGYSIDSRDRSSPESPDSANGGGNYHRNSTAEFSDLNLSLNVSTSTRLSDYDASESQDTSQNDSVIFVSFFDPTESVVISSDNEF